VTVWPDYAARDPRVSVVIAGFSAVSGVVSFEFGLVSTDIMGVFFFVAAAAFAFHAWELKQHQGGKSA
jgi:hypothetical protein